MSLHLKTSGIVLLLLCTLFSFSQQPQIKWHFDTKAPAYGQAAMADIDNDGKPEIVFSCYMNDGKVYALNAEDGSKLWEFSTGDCNDAAPVIYDVDQDSLLEVVVASSCIPKTYCLYGATGAKKWEAPTGGTDSPPAIGDVDNDGKPEILHGEFNGAVICLNGEDGSMKWEKIIDPNASIQTSPALLDVDGNGQLDFVVANWSYTNTNRIWAFRGDTRTQIWVSDAPTDVIYHGASFGDIDGDGKPELAFGCYDNHMYVLNAEDGSLKWSYDFGQYHYIGSPVVMADINNDMKYEMIAAGWYKMKAISDSGTEVWNYNIPDYASCFRGVAISDINDDGFLEPVFGTSEGKVIALDGVIGGQLWILDLAADYGDTLDIDHAPVIGDFDGDGKLDGFVVGGHTRYPNITNDYGRAYAFTLGDGTYPKWSMFQHDIVRSSRVPLDWVTGMPPVHNGDLVITATPNPFSDEIRVRVQIKNPSPVAIELLDLMGKAVLTKNTIQSHSDAVYTWNGLDGLSNGCYLLKVMADNLERISHLIKIR